MKGVEIIKQCVICNVEFKAKRSDAEVCSAKCRQKNWRRKIEAIKPADPETIIELLEAENKRLIEQNEQLKAEILDKRNIPSKASQEAIYPLTTNECVPALPKTLDQIKALCPPDLTGLDRSQWIAKERQKYGI
jgi:hypothetical protein